MQRSAETDCLAVRGQLIGLRTCYLMDQPLVRTSASQQHGIAEKAAPSRCKRLSRAIGYLLAAEGVQRPTPHRSLGFTQVELACRVGSSEEPELAAGTTDMSTAAVRSA